MITRAWPFDGLQQWKYGVLLIDTPTEFRSWSALGQGKGPAAQYDTMSLAEIQALPVSELASDNCLLVLWSTWPLLDKMIEIGKGWGFKYKTGGSWLKTTKTGKLRVGTGYILRTSCEPYLVYTMGRPTIRVRNARNAFRTEEWIEEEDLSNFPDHIESMGREHSRKPPEMREMLQRMCPEAFAAELFARESWPGHDVWGNETTKFDGSAPQKSPETGAGGPRPRRKTRGAECTQIAATGHAPAAVTGCDDGGPLLPL